MKSDQGMKIQYIKWRDSNQELYQREQSDILPVTVIESIGWLLQKNKDQVTLCRDLIDEDCRGMITIPVENIIERRKL